MPEANQINWITIGVSLASSLITAGFAHLLSRQKSKAETGKIIAETQKIYAETEKTNVEVKKLSQETNDLSQKVDSNLSGKGFGIEYYGTEEPTGFDFKVEKNRNWDAQAQKDVGNPAGGNFVFNSQFLNIERSDNEGRFGLVLTKYSRDGETDEFIKADPLQLSKRKILVSCEAKSLNETNHTLTFTFKARNTTNWLDNKSFTIRTRTWTKVDAYMLIDPSKDVYLKIYNTHVEKPPSSVQIRNLKVIEFI
jgi:hypothetical protein